MFPPGLNYSGLVPLAAQNEIETIIGKTFDTLSDATVENMFCNYVQVIARTLHSVAGSAKPVWSVDDFRGMVDDVTDKLIEKCHRQVYHRHVIYVIGGGQPLSSSRNHDAPTLDTFRTRLRSAWHESPAWSHYQLLCHELEPPRTRAASSRRAERERIILPMLDDLDWTPTKWATESGVDPSVTLDYLKGTSNPRPVQRERLRETLATALKQPTLQLPD